MEDLETSGVRGLPNAFLTMVHPIRHDHTRSFHLMVGADTNVYNYDQIAAVHESGEEAMARVHSEYDAEVVRIELDDALLVGDLSEVAGAPGIVVFAHGSGSSRLSTRNRAVASSLNRAGLSTLLFDLLTQQEAQVDAYTGEHRFDIPLLARRLTGTVDWLHGRAGYATVNVGLFGASTGAAAALITASERPGVISAVVSRGGRPDLAKDKLPTVKAPTLLIVGGNDLEVLELNRAAAARLAAPCEISIVQGATHLFEEPGALDEVARLAGDWFNRHMLQNP